MPVIASSRVKSGPFAIVQVPFLIFLLNIAAFDISASTTTTFDCISLENTFTAVIPRVKLHVTYAVTVFEQELTPSSTAPLSAHITTIALLSTLGFSEEFISENFTIISSSLQRLPSGLVRVSNRVQAAFIDSISKETILLNNSFNIHKYFSLNF